MAEANGLEAAPLETAAPGELNPQDSVIVDDQPWYTNLADEALRENPALTRYKSVDDFAKGHLELEKTLGERTGITPPGDDATPEQMAEFYKQLPGYPESHDKYEVEPPAAPEGMGIGEADFGSFLQTMHQSGATKQTVDAAVRWFESYNAGLIDQLEKADDAAANSATEALKAEWGANYDYRMNVALEGLAREYGDLSWADAIISTGQDGQKNLMGNHPQFLKMAYELAVMKGHDRYVVGGRGGPASIQEAQERLSQGRRDLSAGTITESDFNRLQEQLGPLVYGSQNDGLDMAPMTAIDVQSE